MCLRTSISPQIRYLDFDKLNLSCGTPVMMLDVHENLAGDATDDLMDYSHDANSAHLTRFLKKWGIHMPQERVEELIRHLESFSCTH